MSTIQVSYYKGFSVQALIYKYDPVFKRSHERVFDVSVRIGREGVALQDAPVFKYPLRDPFVNFGDARRAALAYAHQVIDGAVPGVSVDQATAPQQA